MAVLPYFVIGPNSLMSLFGLIHGPDKTDPTPAEDWREAKVDVVIPAYNEENTIVLCLESLLQQTIKPNRIILIDDGSKENTAKFAQDFCEQNDVPLEVITHRNSVGKTPGIKQETRDLDGDVEFVLDGDTILESPNYIERVVQELYQGAGIASACGYITPLRCKDREKIAAHGRVKDFYDRHEGATYLRDQSFLHRLARGITNIYRDFLYYMLQHFIYHGQMVMFGSIINPVGCAVAYRRKYLKDVFDEYEELLGDDLTTSEDIFIGFAMLDHGYRNIQLIDVVARSEEPEAQNLPRQIFMWSSSFLQCCYYFPRLLFSPFKVFRRVKQRWEEKHSGVLEKRKIKEAYRQAWGSNITKKYGRPIGWSIFFSLLEKLAFPSAVILMISFQWWEALIVTLIAELVAIMLLSFIIAREYRIKYTLKALLATPIRYTVLMFDLVTIVRFLLDITILKKRRHWRK